MSPQAKKEYLKAIIERYRKAGKKEKSLILDEYCQVCGYHRKYAIERINTFSPARPRKRPGKPSFYARGDILHALKTIWQAANFPNSKRLKSMIPHWLPFLTKTSSTAHLALLKISPATIDRLLKHSRNKIKHRGLSSTKPGSLLRNKIPIKLDQWNEFRPGFLEADTVAHCGTYLDGQFAFTLDCVDIATGWSEQRATWGSGHHGVLEQLKHIEQSLPFPILGFDSDCGHEFINHEFIGYFHNRPTPIQFTRSRAYKKKRQRPYRTKKLDPCQTMDRL